MEFWAGSMDLFTLFFVVWDLSMKRESPFLFLIHPELNDVMSFFFFLSFFWVVPSIILYIIVESTYSVPPLSLFFLTGAWFSLFGSYPFATFR